MAGNILAKRFRTDATFAKLISDASTLLRAKLYTSGFAGKALTRWVKLLKQQAGGVVSTAKINTEAAAIRKYFA